MGKKKRKRSLTNGEDREGGMRGRKVEGPRREGRKKGSTGQELVEGVMYLMYSVQYNSTTVCSARA